MITTVDEYLQELRHKLRGCDRALVQDALSDAEEHLRDAVSILIAENSELSSQEAVKKAMEEFGQPVEVAAEYKKMEDQFRITLTAVKSALPEKRNYLSKFFGVINDTRTWGAVLYMLISGITGIIYGTWIMSLLPLSLTMLIFIIGLPLAGLFLLSVRGLALLEGRLVEALLGTRMPRRPLFLESDKGWWSKFRSLVKAGITWKAMAYLLLHMPLGLLYFTLIITLIGTSLSFILSPILEWVLGIPIEIHGPGRFTPVWLLPFMPVAGAVLLFLTLHLSRFIGKIHGKYAKLMLVR
ncbi:MAG: sensor domain-containing protein [Candidatus Cloacimonetes bacterium]|nr:sensor domain-containing protein [Candidatus Cloacimonadota bacterium]